LIIPSFQQVVKLTTSADVPISKIFLIKKVKDCGDTDGCVINSDKVVDENPLIIHVLEEL